LDNIHIYSQGQKGRRSKKRGDVMWVVYKIKLPTTQCSLGLPPKLGITVSLQ